MTKTQPGGFLHEQSVGRSVEWYTPPELFEALALTFDLDPAAPPGGVPWVPAARHFSRADDGLTRPWHGRVWLNPPYGRDIGQWMDRLAQHGDGVALTFARTETKWFRRAFAVATALCFIEKRLRFVAEDGQVAPWTAGAPSILLAYGLPCALALTTAQLGPVCLVPPRSP